MPCLGPRRWTALLLLLAAASACDDGPGPTTDETRAGTAGAGGKTPTAPAQTVKQPSLTISAGPDRCPTVDRPKPSADQLDAVFVVEWTIVDECTGLGGQYIVARDLDGPRRFFLGAHGCRALPPTLASFPAPPLRYGVLRGRTTAALFTAGPCIDIPNTDPNVPPPNQTTPTIQSDIVTELLESFATETEARSYAASLLAEAATATLGLYFPVQLLPRRRPPRLKFWPRSPSVFEAPRAGAVPECRRGAPAAHPAQLEERAPSPSAHPAQLEERAPPSPIADKRATEARIFVVGAAA